MKQYLKIVIIIIISVIPFTLITGQQEKQSRDKYTLLTMAYNQRPLLLYKGQLQINTSYRFAARTKSFDSDGNKISLKDIGSATMVHTYLYELKYGITDFFEVGIDSYYQKYGIRSESVSIMNGTNVITINRLDEYNGFGDLTLSGALRLPMDYRFYDISLRGGITIPTAKNEPSEPTNFITDYSSPENFTVKYQLNYNNGMGVSMYYLSAAGKITFSDISLEGRAIYKFPSKTGESLRWNWTKSGSTFTYFSTPFAYLPDRFLTINGSVHYQAAGWFDLFIGGYLYKTSSGWIEYFGNKYANPEVSLITFEPGFELQIAPRLTIYQYAGIHIAGKNTDAPFYILTTLSFNMFPFMK